MLTTGNTTIVAEISYFPASHGGGNLPWFGAVHDTEVANWFATEHALTFTGLAADMTYYLLVFATDPRGQVTWYETSFTTWQRRVVATVAYIHVSDDSDWGPDAGEMWFWIELNDQVLTVTDVHRLDSGESLNINKTLAFDPSGPWLDVFVSGTECDPITSFCVGGNNDMADVSGLIDVLHPNGGPGGALPPTYGTHLPPGHDGYFVLATEHSDLAFEVYGFYDVQYHP
jgi:hypothetical protein